MTIYNSATIGDGNFCGTITRSNHWTNPHWPNYWPWDWNSTNAVPPPIPHVHEYVYSGKDAYGDISTCKSCGNVVRTPTRLGE